MSESPFVLTSELIFRQRVFAAIFIVFFMILTLELIRRRALKERYAILWVVAAFVLLPMVLSPSIVSSVSRLIGVNYPPSAILLTGILFLTLIVLHFSVALSRFKSNEEKLVLRIIEQDQDLSQLRQRIRVIEHRIDQANPGAPPKDDAPTRD
ncbi:MAG: DUF2304 domain-containing protein [Deltaproteobacteria bacterium]|nr:DUF2304 domain-containing protein [Deltaproteobacteria bacterium]